MSTNGRKKRGVLTGSIGLGLAGIVGASLLVTAYNPASAETEGEAAAPAAEQEGGAPTVEEAMRACNNAEISGVVCSWQNVKAEEGKDSLALVDEGGVKKWINCSTDTEAIQLVNWSRESSHAFSFGTSLTGSFDLSVIFEKMKAAVTVTDQFEFTTTRTFSSATRLVIPPGETGWFVHSSPQIKVTGDLSARIDNKPNTYVGVTASAPHISAPGALLAHTRKHNAIDTEECKSAPAPSDVTSGPKVVKSRNGDDLPLNP
jgi:hypothetical protein